MLQLKVACKESTAHGLPRIVADRPLWVRLLWCLFFLFFLGLFAKGFLGLVAKLQSRQVTTSLEASSVKFQFPDVYVCFENPMSGTYSTTLDDRVVDEINAKLNDTTARIEKCIDYAGEVTDRELTIKQIKSRLSFLYAQSLPYQLMVDALGHRAEQSVISSTIAYVNDIGVPIEDPIDFTNFYHQTHLRCFRWNLSETMQSRLLASGSSGGLVLALNIDGNDTAVRKRIGKSVDSPIFTNYTSHSGNVTWHQIPISDWTFSILESKRTDRRSGIRIYLSPPGEYPSNNVDSFNLSPGQYYTMDIGMVESVRKPEQFDCVGNPDPVQFVNPYDQTPYNHDYSYSYCYYYEYHRRIQALWNLSGHTHPLPWPLRGRKHCMNLTGEPDVTDPICKGFAFETPLLPAEIIAKPVKIEEAAQEACVNRWRCSNLIYDVRISSADWPSLTSLDAFLRTTVAQARDRAAARDLKVPALDILLNATPADASGTAAAAVIAYAKANLLKLQIRPRRVLCDRLTFSIDYGVENFVADVGGIMGIYLGMSLLTICELLDFFVDAANSRTCGTEKLGPVKNGDPEVQRDE